MMLFVSSYRNNKEIQQRRRMISFNSFGKRSGNLLCAQLDKII